MMNAASFSAWERKHCLSVAVVFVSGYAKLFVKVLFVMGEIGLLRLTRKVDTTVGICKEFVWLDNTVVYEEEGETCPRWP